MDEIRLERKLDDFKKELIAELRDIVFGFIDIAEAMRLLRMKTRKPIYKLIERKRIEARFDGQKYYISMKSLQNYINSLNR